MNDHPIIIFDGECGVCSASVQFVIKHDTQAVFVFASAQSAVGRRLQNKYQIDVLKMQSLALITKHRVYHKSDAVLEIARQLDGIWRYAVLLKILPQVCRNRLYDYVAVHRYQWFSQQAECLLPTADIRQRFLENSE